MSHCFLTSLTSLTSCWVCLLLLIICRHCRSPCKRVVLAGFSEGTSQGSLVLGMCGDNCLIDLTAGEKGPSSPGQWKRKRRCNHTAETIDLSSTASPGTDTVDIQRPLQADEAGPSPHEQPAEVEEQHAAVESEEEPTNRRKGKRKRTWAADRATQIEAQKQLAKAQKAEAKAQKAEAKAMRDEAKAAEKKRVDQFGKIVRYATKASEKTKERMARAMPGKSASLFNCDCRCSLLAMQVFFFLTLLQPVPVSVQTQVTVYSCLIGTQCLQRQARTGPLSNSASLVPQQMVRLLSSAFKPSSSLLPFPCGLPSIHVHKS